MPSPCKTFAPGAAMLWAALLLLSPATAGAHDPDYTADLDRDRCTFTTVGTHPYFPLWPGYSLVLEGEEEDEGEVLEIEAILTVLPETEVVDGVRTRVFEERESEDGELVEISRNFLALCRETGDLWYFGEDVDDIEDGEVVGHEGAWRAGVDGAEAGILQPGSPLVGARFFQEQAPGIALDRAEVLSLGGELTVPAGTFTGVLEVLDTDALEPEEEGDLKVYAPGVGLIADEDLELVEIVPPPCQPDATTLCLEDGRFQVTVDFETDTSQGQGQALLPSDDSGEFWFFEPNNTELIVKVIDACGVPGFDSFWVFAAGLTNVGVTIEVTDTEEGVTREFENELGQPFAPVLDTQAFLTCP